MIDLAFAGFVAVTSVALGWWLRGGGPPKTEQNDEESRRAHEVLARLHDLAARVAADVGEHSSRVEEINEELTATGIPDTEAVVSAVDKLVRANSRMQEQLASAEDRLHEQARQIESAATEARTDVLTGLANRRALDDATARGQAELEQSGTTFSMVMIDVDHFKKFNDRYGHPAGDEVLQGVGRILRQHVRSGAVAARYGGEEFAIVLPGVQVTDAAADAERVRKALDAARFHFAGIELHVTVSAGVAQLMAGEDVAAMIKRADASLYASKGAGRNRTHWHDGQEPRPVAPEPEPAQSPSQPLPPQAPAARQASPATEQTPPQAPEPSPQEPVEASSAAAPRGPAAPQATLCDGNTFCTMLGKRLAEWRRGGLPPTVLLVHIDHYHAIIAKHGVSIGNRIFRTTTQFLRAAIRDMDLVAQFEDATFALMLPGAGLGNAVSIAERLRQAIGQCSLPAGDGSVRFTVSIGGTEARDADDTPKLFQHAQEALAAAVQSGGNCSYFHNGQWSETAAATLQKA